MTRVTAEARGVAEVREFESTLWRLSAFDRLKAQSWPLDDSFARQTLLGATLSAELGAMERLEHGRDVLEVFACCVRLRAPALIYLRCGEFAWPVTLFPGDGVYHSPRSLDRASEVQLAGMTVIDIEPPGVRPPGQGLHERVAETSTYHPLDPALWLIALHGPRSVLLPGLGGRAAYRALRAHEALTIRAHGAVRPAIDGLHRDAAPLSAIARWPGMDLERAVRLINALYVTSNLLVSRTHPAARAEPQAASPRLR
jgi:hypothetical protein